MNALWEKLHENNLVKEFDDGVGKHFTVVNLAVTGRLSRETVTDLYEIDYVPFYIEHGGMEYLAILGSDIAITVSDTTERGLLNLINDKFWFLGPIFTALGWNLDAMVIKTIACTSDIRGDINER